MGLQSCLLLPVLIEAAANSEGKFNLIALEQPKNTNDVGLKLALGRAFEKLKINENRSKHDLGFCSDGVNINLVLLEMIKGEVGVLIHVR